MASEYRGRVLSFTLTSGRLKNVSQDYNQSMSELTQTAKTIILGGSPAHIYGKSGDYYFDNLEYVAPTFWFIHRLVLEHVRDGEICIDVGANIGLTAILMSRLLPRSKVFAIEPGITASRLLERNVTANDAANVVPVRLALGEKSGEVAFFEDAGFLAGSHFAHSGPSNAIVPVARLDDFVDQQSIESVGLVKVDVEGFEPDVLEGGRRVIQGMKPLVIMEVNVWALLTLRDVNPRHFVLQIQKQFEKVLFLEGENIHLASSPAEIDHLLHVAIELHRGVIDIAFCSEPDRLQPIIAPPTPSFGAEERTLAKAGEDTSITAAIEAAPARASTVIVHDHFTSATVSSVWAKMLPLRHAVRRIVGDNSYRRLKAIMGYLLRRREMSKGSR